MKFFIIYVLFITLSISLFSQSNNSVIDTLQYKNYQIILFDDYSWKYVNQDSVEQDIMIKSQAEIHDYIINNKVYEPDSIDIYGEYWDTNEIFAYGGINYANCKDTFAIPLIVNDSFTIPHKGNICSEFGWRGARMHSGIDIKLNTGEPVVAAFSGLVRKSYYNPGGYGRLVILRHPNGLETYYAHLSKLIVKEGDWVNAGDTIGLGGNSGRSYGSHLHWEVRLFDNPFDPRLLVDFENEKLVADTLILTPDKFKYVKELSESKYHYVKSGDTLWAISRRYGVSINRLCSLNGLSESSVLRIGQSIRVR